MTLLVVGDRIAAVGSDGTVAIPAGAEVVDARGKTLIPGLWDMHQHFGDLDGILDIAAGVTTGRDLANDTDTMLARKKSWDSGETIGPRVLLAGFIDGPGPVRRARRRCSSRRPRRRSRPVDKYAELGYVQVKMYSSLDPKLVPVIAKRAHEHGMRVSGHIPATMIAEQAIADGYDEIQHVNMLLPRPLAEVTETRTPARFTEVAERAADVDFASPAVQQAHRPDAPSATSSATRRWPPSRTSTCRAPAASARPGARSPSACRRRSGAASSPAGCRSRRARTSATGRRGASASSWSACCTAPACASSPAPTPSPGSPSTGSSSCTWMPASRRPRCCASPPSAPPR
jgi:hypothetical protein